MCGQSTQRERTGWLMMAYRMGVSSSISNATLSTYVSIASRLWAVLVGVSKRVLLLQAVALDDGDGVVPADVRLSIPAKHCGLLFTHFGPDMAFAVRFIPLLSSTNHFLTSLTSSISRLRQMFLYGALTVLALAVSHMSARPVALSTTSAELRATWPVAWWLHHSAKHASGTSAPKSKAKRRARRADWSALMRAASRAVVWSSAARSTKGSRSSFSSILVDCMSVVCLPILAQVLCSLSSGIEVRAALCAALTRSQQPLASLRCVIAAFKSVTWLSRERASHRLGPPDYAEEARPIDTSKAFADLDS